MKILITGGSGFVGSHLSEFLCTSNQIIVVSRSKNIKNIGNFEASITFEECDVVNHDVLGKIIEKYMPDVIVHLAGETSHSKSFENPLYDLDVNTKSTLFILEKIKTLNLKCRFVLGSTFIVIGRPEYLPVDEKSPCHPTTIYGSHRLASEHYCQIYSNVYGLDTVIFRITNSFGPREKTDPKKNAVNYLIHEAFLGNEISIFNHGEYFRDLIFIEDVISAIQTVIQKGKSGEIYWISSCEKTWFKDFGKMLESLSGTHVKYVESPTYTKKVDVGNFVVDNSKLQSLGWKRRFSLEEGVKKTLDYFRSNDAP